MIDERLSAVISEIFPPTEEKIKSMIGNYAFKLMLLRIQDKELDMFYKKRFKGKSENETIRMLKQEMIEKGLL